MEKRIVYMREDSEGRLFFTWDKLWAKGGYYNLDVMLRLKGLARKDVIVQKGDGESI